MKRGKVIGNSVSLSIKVNDPQDKTVWSGGAMVLGKLLVSGRPSNFD